MPVHVYVPLSFAFCTLVQNFQGLFIFDEIKHMTATHSALTLLGAALALAGALTIQPLQLTLLFDKSVKQAGGAESLKAATDGLASMTMQYLKSKGKEPCSETASSSEKPKEKEPCSETASSSEKPAAQ